MSLEQALFNIVFAGQLRRSGDAPRKICVLGRFEVPEHFDLERWKVIQAPIRGGARTHLSSSAHNTPPNMRIIAFISAAAIVRFSGLWKISSTCSSWRESVVPIFP